MNYKSGDILEVKPLQDVCEAFKSNVDKPYLVTVVSDDDDFLITTMEGGHTRRFFKYCLEWRYGHQYRFKKLNP